ncbi:hypothetical protein [Sediminicoccus rosea]|uniref:Uncharacterized protein n=1 Tax=Sediminicoccus rosea TaxID=1225128 RepID=A0ABZ0PIG8_9PROT|nr:hypothetical protein [Sediminicoccus rosea]WPB85519.1 hypothetical protein R9Z33_01280 [Sediminicoccus rosea]
MVEKLERISILFSFADQAPISALDLSSFIYDINRLYVMSVNSPGYEDARKFVNFGRNSFKVQKSNQLTIKRIRFESPGLIEVIAAVSVGAGGLWAFIQALERIASWPMNREKLRLEIEKLKRDVGTPPQTPQQTRVEPYLEQPQVRSAVRQLEANPIKPLDIQLRPSPDR